MGKNLKVSVLPVPNLVFFPNSTLPLFIIEPVYVSMVQDCIQNGELLAVSMAEPVSISSGRVRYLPKPICGVGRPYISQQLSDGSLRILLKGLGRINLDHVEQNLPYLRFSAHFVPDRGEGQGYSENAIERLQILLHNWIDDNILDSVEREKFRQGITTVPQIIDAISMFMVNDADVRQILLENTSLLERIQLLSRLFQSDIADFQVIRALKNYENIEKYGKAGH
jgi:Lon protease-like protein